MEIIEASPPTGRDLVFVRRIAAAQDRVYRCWTEPGLLRRWFAPAPFRVARAAIDLRPGGAFDVALAGPDGTLYPAGGVFLEIAPQERLVYTDAFASAWEPSAGAFSVTDVGFAADGARRTRVTLLVRHWRADDREAHHHMDFHEGWQHSAQQLEALAQTL